MIPHLRKKINEVYSPEHYKTFVEDLESVHNHPVLFRVVESPVFIPKALGNKLKEAGEQIVDVIKQADFIKKTAAAIPTHLHVPNENPHPDFMCLDFAVTYDQNGELHPQLIELQGFPSLFCFIHLLAEKYKEYYPIPENTSHLFDGRSSEDYIQLMKKMLLKDEAPENVILLEIKPEQQKTRLDFVCTEAAIGIETVCLTKLMEEDNRLYYINKEGKKTLIKRIYNRMIFEDLNPELDIKIDLRKAYDVHWVSHPNWFLRVSKFALPLFQNEYVPPTFYLDQLEEIPSDLENYVLKPLFSYAGQGVIMDVTPAEIEAVKDPSNYILQKKITYEPIINTPDGDQIKCEIRLLYFWEEGADRPQLVTNLARTSKGMIGVNQNKASLWSGGNVAFFE